MTNWPQFQSVLEKKSTLQDFITRNLVTGGKDMDGNLLDTTEIHPIGFDAPRTGGSLSEPRALLSLVSFGGQYKRLMALGKYNFLTEVVW